MASRQAMGDVWALETPDEASAIEDLQAIIDRAFEHDRSAIYYLRSLWGEESWKSVKSKLETEGSTWYVWQMDGVRQHLANKEVIK